MLHTQDDAVVAGPAIIVSFLFAAVVILLIAACFTELAARLHKTGSSYLYVYLTVGELPAVALGISLLLCEYDCCRLCIKNGMYAQFFLSSDILVRV